MARWWMETHVDYSSKRVGRSIGAVNETELCLLLSPRTLRRLIADLTVQLTLPSRRFVRFPFSLRVGVHTPFLR